VALTQSQFKAALSGLRARRCMWLWVQAYPNEVPRFAGDNKLAHPSRLRLTAEWPDEAQRRTLNDDAIHGRVIPMKWIVMSRQDGNLVIASATEALALNEVPLNGTWYDLTPDRMVKVVERAFVLTETNFVDEPGFWLSLERQVQNRRAA
jgi:hypothetical protein